VLVRATRVAMIAVVLMACASPPPTAPPSLPTLSFPRMEIERSAITIGMLASDASDPGSLATLLEEAGFLSGSERIYAGPGERL
jgi:hypothetical protein